MPHCVRRAADLLGDLRWCLATVTVLAGFVVQLPASGTLEFETTWPFSPAAPARQTALTVATNAVLGWQLPESRWRSVEQPRRIVWDAEGRQVLLVDDRRETFTALDPWSMEAARAIAEAESRTLRARRAEVIICFPLPKDHWSSLSEAQRQEIAMEGKRIGQRPLGEPAAPMKLVRSPGAGTWRGSPTQVYYLDFRGSAHYRVQTVDWTELPGGVDIGRAFGSFLKFCHQIAAASQPSGGTDAIVDVLPRELHFPVSLAGLEGCPVVFSKLAEDGDEIVHTELVGVRRATVFAASILPPGGFQKLGWSVNDPVTSVTAADDTWPVVRRR